MIPYWLMLSGPQSFHSTKMDWAIRQLFNKD